MFNLWRRIRNLWRLSNYTIDPRTKAGNTQFLVKDIPTIKQKLATIIKDDKPDEFAPQEENGETSE